MAGVTFGCYPDQTGGVSATLMIKDEELRLIWDVSRHKQEYLDAAESAMDPPGGGAQVARKQLYNPVVDALADYSCARIALRRYRRARRDAKS